MPALEAELTKEFSEYLQDINLEDIRRWTNGYAWLGERVSTPSVWSITFGKVWIRFWVVNARGLSRINTKSHIYLCM